MMFPEWIEAIAPKIKLGLKPTKEDIPGLVGGMLTLVIDIAIAEETGVIGPVLRQFRELLSTKELEQFDKELAEAHAKAIEARLKKDSGKLKEAGK